MDTREFAKGTLLIVDDVPNNLKMLFSFLRDRDFKIRIAQDGEDALEQIAYSKPDLILLDVMMPRLDGFEVCRRLKANPETVDIPIIFMTALTDTVDKVQGFEIGAVDYLTKPVQQEEVLARITTHLSLSNLKKRLEQHILLREQDNHALQQRNRDLEAYAKIVARDLKKPLIRLSGLTKILLKDLSFSVENPEHLKFVHEIEQARRDMVRTIDDLLLLAEVRTQGGTMDKLEMSDIVQRTKVRLLYLIDKYQGKLQIPETFPKAWGYAPWIEKIWENFITNALKNGGRPPRLELGATLLGNGFIKFWIKDNGPALTAEQRRAMFSALDSIDQAQEGLGMSIVQRIVEQYGGRAGVESEQAIGNTFYFILPAVLDSDRKS
jgi:two-component system, sensor histidine kinase and response regulator